MAVGGGTGGGGKAVWCTTSDAVTGRRTVIGSGEISIAVESLPRHCNAGQ